MSKQTDLRLERITVGERFRQDYGEMEAFVESIRKFGVLQPITVDADYNLLAGGRRYEAATRVPLQQIPVIVREVGSEADAREIELIENVHRKDLTWQERARLESRIHELRGGVGVRETAIVLDSSKTAVNRHLQLAEAMELLPELAAHKTEDDAWKAYKKIQEKLVVAELSRRHTAADEEGSSAPHEVRAAKHADTNYLIGDALDGLRAVQACVFNFAEVDPPYGIDLTEIKRRDDAPSTVDEYTEVPEGDYQLFLTSVTGEVYRTLAHNSYCVWWFAPRHYHITREALRSSGFTCGDVPAIWNKGDQGQTNQPNYNLANCYEPFFIARKGNPFLRKQGRSNVFTYAPVPGASKIHATERPLELMVEILEVFSYPGQSLVCPFLGSGVTLRAAYQVGLSGCGWDLEQSVKDQFILQVRAEARLRGEESDAATEDDAVSRGA